MGHRYQRGSKRPDPGWGTRDQGKRHDKGGYTLAGDIPWPTLKDGTAWTDALKRVVHAVMAEEAGVIQWVEWCKPDGAYMPNAERTKTRTVNKAQVEETAPGRWYAVVAWDNRDTWYEVKLVGRHPLNHLLPEPGE